MLSRIRYGNPTNNDIKLLKSRLIDKTQMIKLMQTHNIMYLSATIDQIESINELISNEKKIVIEDIEADDISTKNNAIIDNNLLQNIKEKKLKWKLLNQITNKLMIMYNNNNYT